MLVSKETVTRVSNADGTVMGEIVESGGVTQVRLMQPRDPGQHRTLVVDSAAWREFSAVVRMMDKHVGMMASVDSKDSAAITPAAAPIVVTPVVRAHGNRSNTAFTVTLDNGMHARVGKNGLRVLRKLAANPERWFTPRSLSMGATAAYSLYALVTSSGLVERSMPFRVGYGTGRSPNAQYKIAKAGLEALAKIDAMVR